MSKKSSKPSRQADGLTKKGRPITQTGPRNCHQATARRMVKAKRK